MSKSPKDLPQRKILKQRSPTFDELPDWCTRREAQRYLRLGCHSMDKRLKSGEIPSRRYGRQYRIAKEDLRP
jgi:excisionase family DNA binding protein